MKNCRSSPPYLSASRPATVTRRSKSLRSACAPWLPGTRVVEDYSHTGLSLRRHPVPSCVPISPDLRIVSCAEAMGSRDGQWLEARQGSFSFASVPARQKA